MEDIEPCPRCGALPCDWVDNPHKPGANLSTNPDISNTSPGYVKPGDTMVERVTRAMYEDHPFTVISEALAEACGQPLHTKISWGMSIEIGADHSGLRRLARAAIAALTPLPNPAQSTASDTPSTPG